MNNLICNVRGIHSLCGDWDYRRECMCVVKEEKHPYGDKNPFNTCIKMPHCQECGIIMQPDIPWKTVKNKVILTKVKDNYHFRTVEYVY